MKMYPPRVPRLAVYLQWLHAFTSSISNRSDLLCRIIVIENEQPVGENPRPRSVHPLSDIMYVFVISLPSLSFVDPSTHSRRDTSPSS